MLHFIAFIDDQTLPHIMLLKGSLRRILVHGYLFFPLFLYRLFVVGFWVFFFSKVMNASTLLQPYLPNSYLLINLHRLIISETEKYKVGSMNFVNTSYFRA